MTGITPGQAAYEARERSLWARHGRKDGDRLPVPWAALTDDQRADEEAAGSAVASHLAAAFEAARAREGHSPAPDGEDYVTIRVRVPDHVDVDQVDEIERAAQEWVRDQFPAEDDTEDIELPDDRDGEYDDHRGELEASSARPADDVTRAYNLGGGDDEADDPSDGGGLAEFLRAGADRERLAAEHYRRTAEELEGENSALKEHMGTLAEVEAAARRHERLAVAAEIEAEAATHLFTIRRGMRWAAWVARGKPEDDHPGTDHEASGAMLRGAAERTGIPCCPVEDAARADERERLRAEVTALKVTFWRPGNGPAHTQALEVVPLEDLLRLLEGGGPT